MASGNESQPIDIHPAQTVQYLYINPTFGYYGIDHPEGAKTGTIIKVTPLGKQGYDVNLNVVFDNIGSKKLTFVSIDTISTDASNCACAVLVNWTY